MTWKALLVLKSSIRSIRNFLSLPGLWNAETSLLPLDSVSIRINVASQLLSQYFWYKHSSSTWSPSYYLQEMLLSEITMARLNFCNVLVHFSHSGVDDMADNTCVSHCFIRVQN